MNRINALLVTGLVLLGTSTFCHAGTIDSLILNHEVSAANFFGTNARSMAMGQTGIATSLDGSAMIYNPACLAKVRRLEVRGGVSHLRLENTTKYDGGRYPEYGLTSVASTGRRDVTKTHLDGLSVVVPAPTYRGSLVFGFGVHRLKNFDRTFKMNLRDQAGEYDFIEEQQTETESGGIYAWSGAGAIEISPQMAVGAGINVYTGKAEYSAKYMFAEQYENEVQDTVYYELDETTGIELDHIGISGSVGFTYQASPNLTIGAVIETPSFWNIDEESLVQTAEIYDTSSSSWYWEEQWPEDYASVEYKLRHPFSFGLGAGFSHEQLNLALDLKYTDWSQMEYTDEFSQDLNAVIQEHYKEVVEVRFGAEYVLPDPGISLRVGYFLDPLPFPSAYIESDRKYFTFGVGFLIDQVMTIDIAAVIGGYTINYKNVEEYDPPPYTEEYKTRRIYLTMAYRM